MDSGPMVLLDHHLHSLLDHGPSQDPGVSCRHLGLPIALPQNPRGPTSGSHEPSQKLELHSANPPGLFSCQFTNPTRPTHCFAVLVLDPFKWPPTGAHPPHAKTDAMDLTIFRSRLPRLGRSNRPGQHCQHESSMLSTTTPTPTF